MTKGKVGVSAFFFRNFKFSLKKRGGKVRSRKEKTLDQDPETVTTWLPLTSGNIQADVTDWKILNQDNYWKSNQPRHHPAPASPMWAAFPQIAAFHIDMPPTILLPIALLFVCIRSRATSERCTKLLDNVMSERLPRSRLPFSYV